MANIKGREEEEERTKEVEKIGELFSNHALESDDKEESEYASPMIITIYLAIYYCYYNYSHHLLIHFHHLPPQIPADLSPVILIPFAFFSLSSLPFFLLLLVISLKSKVANISSSKS